MNDHKINPSTGCCDRCGVSQDIIARHGHATCGNIIMGGIASNSLPAGGEASASSLEDGKKYIRSIKDRYGNEAQIDVYDVLKCFDVTDQAIGHAIKKLLCAGKRGKASRKGDLVGAKVAIERAIQMCDEE